MAQSNLRTYGGNMFSYQTMIKQTLADGTTIGNVTEYSPTTSRHQKLACVHSADILLDNVPVGCNDLRDFAIRAHDFDLSRLIDRGDVLQCPNCHALNAYAYQDSNIDPNTNDRRIEDTTIPLASKDVYHIPAASGFEWQCGKCKTSFAPIDSPIMAEVYTHIERH